MIRQIRMLGPYTSGETGRQVILDFDDEPLDLSSALIRWSMEKANGTAITVGQGQVAWVDDSIGRCSLDFVVSDLTLDPGVEWEVRLAQIWAKDAGDKILATLRLVIPIDSPVGTPPTWV